MAAKRAEDLAGRLERSRELAADIKGLDERARVFRSLSQELDGRHIIPYLQAEALQVLAGAGAQRLASLSDGRYRLVCRDDEFLVVDTWNGDEERSVRTLSGGETFLASLALSLALADQVRSLSSTDRARLDSLFLDEGFGTLDQEALQMVVDAIELLAGDGRLVGVITHVQELAERFPRVQVEKSPRGSHLRVLVT
jgi:exonuclease SbcC